MDILDDLFERSKPPEDESEIVGEKTVFDGYEAITSLCTFRKWKGKVRELSTVTIHWTSPSWSARLNDSENRRSVTATGPDVASAIESLDKLLCAREVIWWYWPSYSNGKKKAVKSTT